MLQQTKISKSRGEGFDPVSVRERPQEGNSTRRIPDRSPVVTGIYRCASGCTSLKALSGYDPCQRRPPHLHLTPPDDYGASGKVRKYRLFGNEKSQCRARENSLFRPRTTKVAPHGSISTREWPTVRHSPRNRDLLAGSHPGQERR